MADPRYDVLLADPVSGESVGLILDEPMQWQSTQPMAARVTEAKDWRAFDEWSVIEQSSWHHGRGLEIWDPTDPERFYDSYSVDTRIRDQLTLAPAVSPTGLSGAGFLVYNPTLGTVLWATIPPPSSPIRLGQSFQCSAHTCKKIALRLQGSPNSAVTFTLRVQTDSGGSPSGTLVDPAATATALVAQYFEGWVTFDFGATGFSLSGSTTYWLVLTASANGGQWIGGYGRDTSSDPYANGVAKGYTTAFGWQATAYLDFFFNLLSISELAGTVLCFCQHSSKWYCGAGKGVYVWDNTNGYWTASKDDFANNVSDLVSFGGNLWVAQSDGNAWTFDGTSTWTEKTGITATYLLVYRGYLYRSTYSTDNRVYYTANGSTWSSSPWKVGNPGREERITSLAGHGYDVYVGTRHGVYALGPESAQGDLVDQIKDFFSQYSTTNCYGMKTWARDGKLYFPVLHSLLSYQDGLLDSVGPDRDAGMPTNRQGTIRDLLSLNNWLVAALYAGAGNSSVLVYNGTGWHEMFRAPVTGEPCYALGYDTTVTPHRLWLGCGTTPYYIEMPDNTDNPYQYSSSTYASSGYLITPWLSLDMLPVDKDFQEFGVQGEMPASGSLTVSYEVDRYGSWTELFTVDANNMHGIYIGTFPFESAFTTNPTVGSGSTTKTIKVDSTSELAAGTWVRINDQVRQVASVTDGTTFVLVRPLSSAPASGDTVYPARPCGVEIRFKIELLSSNAAQTPKLQAWWLKCMPMISDKLGAALTSTIYDGQKDHGGAPLESAGTRAALLHSFAKRPTPIDLTDKAGITRRVKVTSISEVQRDWQEGVVGFARQPKRTFSLSVVEL